MDGVIYHGNQILPGVPEFIQWLHDEKKEYLFLTNNSGYESQRTFNRVFKERYKISPSDYRSTCVKEMLS